MTLAGRKKEIDHHVLRLIVGLIACLLPGLVELLAADPLLASISAAYHADGAARDAFVGAMFAIAAFLFAYNGDDNIESIYSKIAAVSAVCIALFPTSAGEFTLVGVVHYVAAAAMFLVLAYFCAAFCRTAKGKSGVATRGKVRYQIYRFCLAGIVAAILCLLLYLPFQDFLDIHVPRYVFYFESLGLLSFGIAWLVASRIIPVVTTQGERLPLLVMLRE